MSNDDRRPSEAGPSSEPGYQTEAGGVNTEPTFSVRKRKKRRAVEDPGGLTINSLMDILTILLVFLLKSYSANPVNVTQSDALKLPDSTATLEAEEAVPLAITANGILVNDQPVATVTDGKVDASVKRDGADGFFITPLFDALAEEADKHKRIAKHNATQEFKGMALVIAHKDTPFRLLNEVLYTAGQAQYGQFKFAVIKQE